MATEPPSSPRAPDGTVPEVLEPSVDAAVRRIEAEARRIGADTRLEIQEQTRRWATASAALFLLALTVLALFGVREIWNLEEDLDAARRKAEERMAELDADITAATARVTAESQRVAALIGTVSDRLEVAQETLAEQTATLAEMEAVQRVARDAQTAAQEVTRIYEELERIRADVRDQLADVRKLQNAFFQLYVMYPGDARELRALLAALRDAGFVVLPENVLRVSVDATELIYYDQEAPRQVEEARRLLEAFVIAQGRGGPVRARLEERNAPRDLLIKVRRD